MRITHTMLFENENPEKLRVLDFDDTIAHTTERVRVETPGEDQPFKMITSDKFATYELGQGERFDPDRAFEEFSRVDVEKAEPIPFISDLLKTFVDKSGSRKILILTARGPEVEPFVMEFLDKKLGITDPGNKIDFRGVKSKEPSAKVQVIEEYLNNNPTIEFVSFYDDSGDNVKSVIKYLADRGIQGDVRQVVTDDEGDVHLVSPEMSEAPDLRSMTREFLRGEQDSHDESRGLLLEDDSFDARGMTRDFLRKLLSD